MAATNTQTHTDAQYLTRKELAHALGRSRTYVWAMERAGFHTIAGQATLQDARTWLTANPNFRVNRIPPFDCT